MAVHHMGGKCSSCGLVGPLDLYDFHHTDMGKDFSLSGSGQTRSWGRMAEELKRCVLLCAVCHRHAHNQSAHEAREAHVYVEGTCRYIHCGKASANLNYCDKSCCGKETSDRRRRENKKALVLHKGWACTRCSISDLPPYAYDFHHRDPDTKEFQVATKLGRNLKRLIPEADKCDLLCANCRRIVLWETKTTRSIEDQVLQDIEDNWNKFEDDVNQAPRPKKVKLPPPPRKTKIAWPSDEELASLLDRFPASVLAKQLGVSGAAIRKRCLRQDIPLKPRGYWAKFKASAI